MRLQNFSRMTCSPQTYTLKALLTAQYDSKLKMRIKKDRLERQADYALYLEALKYEKLIDERSEQIVAGLCDE